MVTKFRKEKLARKAIDELAKRNTDSSAKNAFPYTTATGERVIVSPAKVLLRRRYKRTKIFVRTNLSISSFTRIWYK